MRLTSLRVLKSVQYLTFLILVIMKGFFKPTIKPLRTRAYLMLLYCLNTQTEAWPKRYLCPQVMEAASAQCIYVFVFPTVRCLDFCWRIGRQKTAHSFSAQECRHQMLPRVLLSAGAST